ncbi:methyltransferase [Microdochium trichocladiopsis]|uniref:Methyltransferase n=1 Tax=Microdochium trichocladiopsis TaxID=1682393 RepID=A0A9P8XVA3_9PEZI|nr:methyltransferase [Microdochium trichocladiopsis]KAH7014442.1 methyltransferase [Microdochium trichocladiopsis]
MASNANSTTDAPAAVPEHLKDRVKASYDAIATEYNDWTKDHWHIKTQYLDKLLGHLESAPPAKGDSTPAQPRRYLELGCGAGVPILDTLLARDPATTVVANDLSTAQIDLARSHLAKHGAGRVEYAPGDMLALDFPANSFDAVIALYSICHLPPAEQVDMFRKLGGWVKPGGGVLVNVTNEVNKGLTLDTWLADDKGWMYWSGLGPEETLKVVREQAGLDVVETAVDGGVDDTFFWIIARKGGGVST